MQMGDSRTVPPSGGHLQRPDPPQNMQPSHFIPTCIFHLIFMGRVSGTGTCKNRIVGSRCAPVSPSLKIRNGRSVLCPNLQNIVSLTQTLGPSGKSTFAAQPCPFPTVQCLLWTPGKAIPLIASFGHPPCDCHAWTSSTPLVYTCC